MKRYTKIAFIVGIAAVAAFIIMPERKSSDDAAEVVSASVCTERIEYFALHGWEVDELYSKKVIIPDEFSGSYEEYAAMQDKQGLPLRDYAGREAQLYVYQVKNYSPDNKELLAELLVCNDIAVASMIYSEDCGSLSMSVQ